MLNGKSNGNNEIRMIWLMALMIAGGAMWYAGLHQLSYLCALAIVISVMHYVDDLQKPADDLTEAYGMQVQPTSKAPLYISSIAAVIGGIAQIGFLTALGISAWIFFFLRWLKRLERNLYAVQHQVQRQRKLQLHGSLQKPANSSAASAPAGAALHEQHPPAAAQMRLSEQLKSWLFQGNPVLKAAVGVLVIGVVLLLRFATEHWQLSLSLKLLLVAAVSIGITGVGFLLQHKNRGFALALEGLGLAALFLTLFFAYYNHVIPNLWTASLCFIAVMAPTIWLSLRQQSIELALMALMIAYIAPFTLPVRSATAVELMAYYLLINLAVAVLSTLRPWKMLNQIAFLMTVMVGGGYAFYHGDAAGKTALTYLTLAHTAVFVWLSFRYSQLLAKQDLSRFQLQPVLDVALIFGAPIAGYIALYLMYFDDTAWQAGFSLLLALVYLGLYGLSKRNQSVSLISQSYFSLMLIFLALIPPILMPDHWSTAGWAAEGAFIFIFALYRESAVSRYLAMGLMAMAGLSGLHDFTELHGAAFQNGIYWTLCISYLASVLVSNSVEAFRKQLTGAITVFQSLQMLSAAVMLFILLLDQIDSASQVLLCLLIITLIYTAMNEWLLRCQASWTWLLPKWIGLLPLYAALLYMLFDFSQAGEIVWKSAADRMYFALTGALLTLLWLRPRAALKEEKEWVSLGAISSLALTSMTLLSGMPYISMAVLPLLFAGWCYWAPEASDWKMFWQTRSSLMLTLLWMVCSQVFSREAFQLYFLPLLNPFDLISMLMLAGFIWMLSQQMKAGLDRSMGAVLMVLGLLWLSSYAALRALHYYLATPYNTWALWSDAAVQLSFTFLWVMLAFVSMSYAAKRGLRPLWILGSSILVLVTLKLVLLDLSHIGTLSRVISFLGAGFVMLVIAYIAPMPEAESGKAQ